MTTKRVNRWQVQVRKSRAHKWVNKASFKTRGEARALCADLRGCWTCGSGAVWFDWRGYGFGFTRVVDREAR